MIKFNKKFIIVVAIISIMSLTLSACTKKEEGIVAKVNGEGITQEEFDREFNMFKDAYKRQFGEDVLSQETEDNRTLEDILRENVLEKLIIERLISKEIEGMDIKISDEEIEEQFENYKNSLGGEEEYKKFLENNDFTEEFLKENIKKELLFQKHKEDFLDKTEISEEEKKKYFDANKDDLIQVRASHILVKTEEEGKAILKKLEKGEEFASLAATESIDSATAIKGGDLGYFGKNENFVPEFKEAAFSLDVGQVSDLVKSDFGYHIILIEDRKDSYEDLKDDIESTLKNQKYIDKISKLREEGKVKIYMELEKEKEKKNK